MQNRILLTKSEIYKAFESKNKSLDLSMMNKSNFIKIKDIEFVLNEIKMRNYPLTTLIMNALENGRIILTTSDKAGSSIQLIPAMGTHSDKIETVFVNCALISKKEKVVDNNTGDIKEATTIKSYEELYNLLLGAFVALNTNKILNDMSTLRIVAESYIDIVAQIISRAFGNPMDGDKLRFIVKNFFYNGIMTGEDLANVEKYNIDSARLLSSKYPEFFAIGEKSLTSMLEVIAEEFPAMHDVTLEKFIGEGVKLLGANGVYMLDNYPYMFTVFTSRLRKDRSGIFNGYILRTLDPYSRKMLTDLLRTIV